MGKVGEVIVIVWGSPCRFIMEFSKHLVRENSNKYVIKVDVKVSCRERIR